MNLKGIKRPPGSTLLYKQKKKKRAKPGSSGSNPERMCELPAQGSNPESKPELGSAAAGFRLTAPEHVVHSAQGQRGTRPALLSRGWLAGQAGTEGKLTNTAHQG